MTTSFLESIRLYELAQVIEMIELLELEGACVLEIGAGTGWQAKEMSRMGFNIFAIDIPSSNHRRARIWPIIDFDGRYIPFPDDYFDLIFSSNVMEHVEDLDTLNREIVRVLRPGGRVIHYVPTVAWRSWSLAVFYLALVRDLWRLVFSLKSRQTQLVASEKLCNGPPVTGNNKVRSLFYKVRRRLVPHVHGVQGSCWSELFRFSRASWDRYFNAAGWSVDKYQVNGLFLTGEMLLGALLPTTLRSRLSNLLGSTAHLYVLKRSNTYE